jgi:hypothetical protein
MKRIDIQRLREMHAAATPGPWKIVATKDPSGEWDAYAKAKDGLPVDLEHTDNLPAVCAAMNALPALLREVELLRASNNALWEYIQTQDEVYGDYGLYLAAQAASDRCDFEFREEDGEEDDDG